MAILNDEKRPKSADEQAEWVMSFIDDSYDKCVQPMEEMWDEVEDNFLVRPFVEQRQSSNTNDPLNRFDLRGKNGRGTILKDPETHQEIMTIVAGIVSALMPEPGYVKAKPRGPEDVYRGKTMSSLLEYYYGMEGHFISLVEWLMGGCIHGTGIKEQFWDYIEEPRTFRRIDPVLGTDESDILIVPVFNDVRMETFDIRDFFPDPGHHMLNRMSGAARRFKINESRAMNLAEGEIWEKDRVDKAIIATHNLNDKSNRTDEPNDIDHVSEAHTSFGELTVYRYVGEVPFKSADGITRREIVVVGGEVVRSAAWPRALPWADIKITPRKGSFYGISPGEVTRYDQDLIDTIKMMLADAVIRTVHPPQMYDRTRQVDLARLRRWNPDDLIGVDGDPRAAVATANYNPDLNAGFALQQGIKGQMREGSSATDANQGFGIGSKRLSASEAVGTFERAGVRPEMFNIVVERAYMPPAAKYVADLYKEFLELPEDLAERIGEAEASVQLADIMTEFDLEFIGSRLQGRRADELSSFREIMSAAANENIAPLIPIIPVLQKHFESLGQHEIAAMVGDPRLVKLHMLIRQQVTELSGLNPASGNGNGTTPSNPPDALLPAQTLGASQ